MSENKIRLKQILTEADIQVTDEMCEQLCDFYELLVEKNKVMNLTAITERDDVFIKHFLDSLIVDKYWNIKSDFHISKAVDLGTGAGFPGLPIKIAHPKWEVTLVDSLNKRIQFLNEVIEKLGLTGIHTIHSRAEDVSREKQYREQFDLCVSRAVANLSTLSEYCLPLVKKGGFFVSYKSSEIEEELENAKKAVKLLGGETSYVEKFDLPQTDFSRSLVFIQKTEKTPAKYPRKAGVPSKSPL